MLEMSGASAAAELGMSLLRTGGALVLVGAVFPSPDLAINPEDVIRRALRIEGVHNYAPADLAAALELIAAAPAHQNFDALVERRFPLEEAEAAFEEAAKGRALRVAVV